MLTDDPSERAVIADALRSQIEALRVANAREHTTLAQRSANCDRIAELQRALEHWLAEPEQGDDAR